MLSVKTFFLNLKQIFIQGTIAHKMYTTGKKKQVEFITKATTARTNRYSYNKKQKLPVARGKQDKDKATIIEFYNKKYKHMQPCKISQQRLKNPTTAAPT
jgi:hypothetical protein